MRLSGSRSEEWLGRGRCSAAPELFCRDQARSKRSAFITLIQAATKSRTNFCLRVVLSIDFGKCAQPRVRSEDKIDAGGGPFHLRRVARSRPSNTSLASETGFHSVPISTRFTKKSLVSVPGRSVKTPCRDGRWFAPSTRIPPTRTVISGAVSVSSCARSTSISSGETADALFQVVAESVGERLEHREGIDVGLRLRRVGAARRERHLHVMPACFAAASTAAQPPSTIRSASDTFFPPPAALNSFLDLLQRRSTFASWAGWLTSQSLLRRQADARAIRSAALVGAAERRGRSPGGGDEIGNGTGGEDLRLEVRDVLRVDQRVVDRRERVLPDQFLGRNLRAEIARRAAPYRGA